MKLKIKLNTISDAVLFSAKCGEYEDDIDYACGKYMIDAKSIVGVIGVGLGHKCEVSILSGEYDVLTKFKEDMNLWVV